MAKEFSFNKNVVIKFNDESDSGILLNEHLKSKKNVYIVNYEEATNANLLFENLLDYNLEDGFLVFDLPNFSDKRIDFNKIIDIILKTVKINKNTRVMALHNRFNHFENHEFSGLDTLNELVASRFSVDGLDVANQLFFPNVVVNNAEPPFIMFDYVYDLHSVKKSSQVVNFALNKLKNSNLSPYEKFLAAYDYVASLEYNRYGYVRDFDKTASLIKLNEGLNLTEENEIENQYLSRTIANSLNNGLIVCTTYADLLVLLCQRLGIISATETLETFSKDDDGNKIIEGHRRAIVYLKDEKYNLNGYYISDPTNDSKNSSFGLDFKQFYHHAIPVLQSLYNENSDFVSFAKGEELKVRDDGRKEFASLLTRKGFVEDEKEIPIRYEFLSKLLEELDKMEKSYDFEIENAKSNFIKKQLQNEKLNTQYKHYLKMSELENALEQKKEIAQLKFMIKSQHTKSIEPKTFVNALKEIVAIIKKSKEPFVYANSIYVENASLKTKEQITENKTFDYKLNKDFFKESLKFYKKLDFDKSKI